MAVMLPLQQVASEFRPGGAYAAPTTGGYYNPVITAPAPQIQQPSGTLLSPSNTYSGVKNIGSILNGNGLPQSQTLNSIGSAVGFSPGGLTYTATGALPWQTAGSVANPAMLGSGAPVTNATGALGTSTLSSTLGAAGIGAFAGNFLGKIGGNSTGGSIGGAAGAAIGNMIAPGIGGFIGGAIGGIAGGFFGGKPATAASSFANDGINPDGTFINARVGSKGAGPEFGQQTQNELSKYFTGASKALGIQFANNTQINAGYNSLRSGGPHPGYVDVHGDNIDGQGGTSKKFFFDPNDAAAKDKAYRDAVALVAQRSGFTDTAKLNEYFDSMNAPQQQGSSAPFIPIKGQQRFADFMSKYTQGTQNGNAA